MGGWVTLTVLTLLRNGDMVDYTGHAALILLMLALMPVRLADCGHSRCYRRLGWGAFAGCGSY